MERLLDPTILLFEESGIIFYYRQYDRTKFNTLYPVSVPLCHPENSYIEAPQNCQPQRNFSNFGNRWKSENWSGKIVFQFKPMEHSHANVQSYSPYYGILCNFL